MRLFYSDSSSFAVVGLPQEIRDLMKFCLELEKDSKLKPIDTKRLQPFTKAIEENGIIKTEK